MEIYLDNSATTKVCKSSAQKALQLMTTAYGNPSSLHSMGFDAQQEMSLARIAIAKKLGVTEREIIFTSGGTEANNLAIFGAVQAQKRFGNQIVTTAIEHPSVLGCMAELEKQGFEIVYLKPDAHGMISPEQIQRAVTEKTILVSIMLVNNEVGSILPVEAAANVIRRKNVPALLHVDAVQAFGKQDIKPKKSGIDLLTVSGHKIHAPKGVGALYCAKGVRISPCFFGGGQENGLRPGTEALSLIGAFGEAVRQLPEIPQAMKHIQRLYDCCRTQLAKLPGISLHSPERGLPYILHFSTGSVRSETMIHFLAAKHIFVSGGSACAKGKQSHVLTAMGLSRAEIKTAIRVSFCYENTVEQITAFVQAVEEGLSTLATGAL